MPRSGTTVIGERLCGEGSVCELYEPLNPEVGLAFARAPFPMLASSSSLGLISPLDLDTLISRISQLKFKFGLRRPGSTRSSLFNRTRVSAWKARLNPRCATLVWKDPFAAFLAGEINRRFGIPVVFTLRGPLETAASFVRMNWEHDNDELAGRYRLSGGDLPVTDDYLRLTDVRHSVQVAVALWLMLHSCVRRWMIEGLPILWVGIDENISDPDGLGLRLSQYTGLTVATSNRLSGDSDSVDYALPNRAHIRERSAASIQNYWQSALNASEVSWINECCSDIWRDIEARLLKS